MENGKKLIWTYWSVRGQNLDNNYSFYEDGTIIHHYDKTIMKLNVEENILPSEVSDYEKDKILLKCKEQCSFEIWKQIKSILQR